MGCFAFNRGESRISKKGGGNCMLTLWQQGLTHEQRYSSLLRLLFLVKIIILRIFNQKMKKYINIKNLNE